MKRIGIMGDVFYTWGGGNDFVSLIVKSLDPSEHIPILYLPKNNGISIINSVMNTVAHMKYNQTSYAFSYHNYRDMMAYEIKRPLEGRDRLVHTLQQQIPSVEVRYFENSLALAKMLIADSIEVCLPSSLCLGKKYPVPWIGYLFDLQHKKFPDLFEKPILAYRDREFRTMLDNAKNIIVPSKAVKKDIEDNYPSGLARIHPLPFAAPGPTFDPSTGYESILNKYNIKNNYFIIMNQFWVHKNHSTAFKAMARLFDSNELNFDLICTGKTEDYRNPGYFTGLVAFLRENSLEERVKILGYIPKKDQITLMYHSLGVVQPTLFEGGAGGLASVDATTYGKPIILSDIPVNHEVIGDNLYFFDPTDDCELAEIMRTLTNGKIAKKSYNDLLLRGKSDEIVLRSFIKDIIDYVI